MDAARAAALKARLDYDRAVSLLASKVIPPADYDAAKARADGAIAAVDTAEARLASARIALADTSLRTPVDALVLARSVEIGNLISPNTVAFRLADVSRIKVRFAVADEVASRLQIGSPVTVTADAVEAKLPAVISKLHPQSSSDARTFDVEATVLSKDASLLLGMVVSVALPGASASRAPVICLRCLQPRSSRLRSARSSRRSARRAMRRRWWPSSSSKSEGCRSLASAAWSRASWSGTRWR